MTITLEQQIELIQDRFSEYDYAVDKAVLASLRRLQAIEQQGPIGALEKNFIAVSTFERAKKDVKIPEGTKLYALPVSPAIPEGYETKYLLLAGKVRNVIQYANYLMHETRTIVDENAYILARDNLLKSLEIKP